MKSKKLLNVTSKDPRLLSSKMKEGRMVAHPYYRGISRLNYKPDFFEHRLAVESIQELRSTQTKSQNWSDTCLARAAELFKMRTGPVYVSWSGGIDSTTTLLSLLTVASESDRKRLVVVLSHHSVLENPSFYQKYVVGLPYLNILDDIPARLKVDPTALFVTGELGDQLFGSDILSSACEKFGDEILHESYLDTGAKIIECDSLLAGLGNPMFERLQPIADECPFPIRSSHDFWWWWNFTQKWQHVKYRVYHQTSWPMEVTYEKSVRHFFDSVEFQLWSLENHDLKIRKTWNSYKFAAKEFIANLTGDSRQLNLPKIQSLEKTYLVSENRIAIAEDLSVITSIEELLQYAIGQ